jgi:hypothetical protein
LHHYILLWAAPYQRLAYWDKFGTPEGYLTRRGDHYDIPSLWWIDPSKQAKLTEAMKNNSPLPVGQIDARYWETYAKEHPMLGTDVGSTATK